MKMERPTSEPLVWESTTPVYTQFITDSRYRKLRPSYRRWYRPICPNCGPRQVAEATAATEDGETK